MSSSPAGSAGHPRGERLAQVEYPAGLIKVMIKVTGEKKRLITFVKRELENSFRKRGADDGLNRSDSKSQLETAILASSSAAASSKMGCVSPSLALT
jgi:hypothetical protein